jgi:hypothetical protein
MPQKVPILDIARNELKLDVQFIPLSEEQDIYGMTIFDDGYVEIYDTDDREVILYICPDLSSTTSAQVVLSTSTILPVSFFPFSEYLIVLS